MAENSARLRTRPPRGAFFAGSRRLQSDLLGMALPGLTEDQCASLARELARLGLPADIPPGDGSERFCALVIACHAALLREAGFYFPEPAELAVQETSHLAIAVPKIAAGTELATELFRQVARQCAQTALHGAPAETWLTALRQEIGKVALPLLAATHMVRAAYELGMPILEWHSVFMQAGYGANGVALTGSITQDTSSIGVHFAREKSKANALLARAGFPIPEGGLARDLGEARERAAALGYPVVVKPADRDGGAAVSSDIQDPAELEQAFARARAASPRVLVEKHIGGLDYRLLFYRDELLVALERTPGGVTGNGRDSIRELVDATNTERKGTPLLEIAFDAESVLMLRRQGLTPSSVPAKARFVPLRRAANHALGGTIRRFDDIHPDNVDLARRAMRLLRLDLAGIDLILPDATRSWREAGGAICEVNAQPFVGEPLKRDFYKEILQKLVPGGGRIPLVLTVGAPDAGALGKLARMPGLAIVDRDGARRGGHPLSVPGMPWLTACQAALYDRETAAALFIFDPGQPMTPLSPADRFTAAVVLEAPPEGPAALLRRADAIHALDAARPALEKVGLEFAALRKADIAGTLETLLGGAKPSPATPAPARRGTARPAPRRRR